MNEKQYNNSELREISPAEKLIVSTEHSWETYLRDLFKPQYRLEELRGNKKSEEALEDEILADILKRSGVVVDLGAGFNKAVEQLNDKLLAREGEAKAVGIDLKICFDDSEGRELRKKVSPIIQGEDRSTLNESAGIIGADILALGGLPLKNETVQLALCRGIIPYFLEDRESEGYHNLLLESRLGAEREKAEEAFRENPRDPVILSNLERIRGLQSTVARSDSFNARFDMDLLATFFKNIKLVLKPGLEPPAEARISHFFPFLLVSPAEGNSRQRLIDFAAMIGPKSFSSARFYPSGIYGGGLSEVFQHTNYFIDLIDSLPEKEGTIINDIFQVGKIPLYYEDGILVLQKK